MMASGRGVVVQQRLLPAPACAAAASTAPGGTEKADVAVAALDEVAGQLITGIEVETSTFMSTGWRAIAPTSTTGKAGRSQALPG